MKKFILHILWFFAIVAVVDIALGLFFSYMQRTAAGGTSVEYHVCKEGDEDILIMGSSRASHHYVSRLISDSLGMSCYNGGQDGNGIIMQYGRWKLLSKRHVPKLIVYDVEPAFDLAVNDNERYVDRLKPFTDDCDVKTYVVGLFPMERWKLISHMYRYNYKFLEILFDYTKGNDPNCGYKPLFGHIRQDMIEKPKASPAGNMVVDEKKYEMLCKLVEEVQAEGSHIIFVSSPYWQSLAAPDLRAIQKISEKYGVPFYNYYDSTFSSNPDWFADSMHLNDDGAMAFTGEIVGRIRDIIAGI